MGPGRAGGFLRAPWRGLGAAGPRSESQGRWASVKELTF